nr:PREDICTED: uncharacterized protein LOC107983038 [Anolis carolinensis]|eukprot:XP_016850261.1 PREDICTED: uncharacterized protein LOC107983038 [Anolis carolinensis]
MPRQGTSVFPTGLSGRSQMPGKGEFRVKFNRDPKQLSYFITNVRHFMEDFGDQFPSESAKIYTVGANLKEAAADWLMQMYDTSARELASLEDFLRALRERFEDPLAEERAKAQLKRIYQGGRTVSEYALEFKATPGKIRDWSDTTKLEYFRAGLRSEMLEWALHRGNPRDLEDWILLAGRVEVDQQQISRRPRESSRFKPPTAATRRFSPRRGSKSLSEHIKLTREVLRRLKENQLYAKLSKCEFHKTELDYLGFRISTKGIAMDPTKVQDVLAWEPPRTRRQLQGFLGFANFYRQFIKDFAKLSLPLTELLKTKGVGETRKTKMPGAKLNWTPECQEAFEELKRRFTSQPILVHAQLDKPFVVHCDASEAAYGAILLQADDEGALRPCAYLSRKFTETEWKWRVWEKEAFAVKSALSHWRHFWKELRSNLRYGLITRICKLYEPPKG